MVCNGYWVRSRQNIRSTVETITKVVSPYWYVLTLSAIDRQMFPMLILWPSTRKEGRPWRVGSWCLVCFLWKMMWELVARSSCGVLALKVRTYIDFFVTTFLGALEISLKPREKVFESLVCKLISLQNKLIRTTFEQIDYSKMFSPNHIYLRW